MTPLSHGESTVSIPSPEMKKRVRFAEHLETKANMLRIEQDSNDSKLLLAVDSSNYQTEEDD